MSNDQKINESLKYWAEIASSNESFKFNSSISKDYIYNYLIHLGVDNEDKLISLRDERSKKLPYLFSDYDEENELYNSHSTFANLIKLYSRKKTHVYVAPNWTNFCQFISSDLKAKYSENHIKVYVPLDGDHIELGAKMIFDFLEKNNISHASKMSRRIRFDDIVIRLLEPSDVNKLLDFISNSNYIKCGLIKPNPFAFQKNGVALAVDGYLSYNTVVAVLIDLYIDYCRKNNKLKNVSSDDFYAFIYKKYQNQFINGSENTLYSAFRWRNEEEMKNYREVISLILKVHTYGFSFDDLVRHYELSLTHNKAQMNGENDVISMLIELLIAMTKRFGHPNGIRNVEAYIMSADPIYVTSNNDLRKRIVNCNFRNKLLWVLKTKKIDFNTYLNYVINNYNVDLNSLYSSKTR